MAAGPFCFVYGTTAILMAVGFADMRTKPVVLFVACMLTATVVEWLTAKLLERLHNRKWWDYSDKKFNLNGYVCLQYSVLWGALGMVTVLWGNGLLLRLCALVPDWLLHPLVWVALGIAALDQLGSAVLVGRYAAQHPVLEQLNQKLERAPTPCAAALPCMWKSVSSAPTRKPPDGSPWQCRRNRPIFSARQTCCGCLSSGLFWATWWRPCSAA